jgi:hypothetical protein
MVTGQDDQAPGRVKGTLSTLHRSSRVDERDGRRVRGSTSPNAFVPVICDNRVTYQAVERATVASRRRMT